MSSSRVVVKVPNTVEEVFQDFKGRRDGLIQALTTDYDNFYQKCNSDEESLCLFGFPDGQWEVNKPAEKVVKELPEPTAGINFIRKQEDWLSFVAEHSDTWLLSVAFCYSYKAGFDKANREWLFDMINELPSLCDVVADEAKKQAKGKSSVLHHNDNNSTPWYQL